MTPPADSGLLEGITRALVLQWCREAGVPVDERTVPLAAIHHADEVFITSSTRDVLPVHAVDDRPVEPGPVTVEVARLFARRAAEDLDP